VIWQGPMPSSASERRVSPPVLRCRRLARVYSSIGVVRTAVHVEPDVRWSVLTGSEAKPGGGSKDFHLAFYA